MLASDIQKNNFKQENNSAPNWIYQLWLLPTAREGELQTLNTGEQARAFIWEAAAVNPRKKTQQAKIM